jgi:fatty-acyl-CoA synthase
MTGLQHRGHIAHEEALNPTAFLDRSGSVFGDRIAVVDGEVTLTYREFRDYCQRLAGFLTSRGVSPGDRVCVLAPNTLLMLAAHYAVLYAGGVLVALNTRLAAAELGRIVQHSGCRILLVDDDLTELADKLVVGLPTPPSVIVANHSFDVLVAESVLTVMPLEDERDLMALNYTSGTTGNPKGVMYTYRGAFLQSLAMAQHFNLTSESRYLWTLPMFHCNGWCFTWAVTAVGGTHICLPRVAPDLVWPLIKREGVTHFCAAPTVLVDLLNHEAASPIADRLVRVAVGGAPPSPKLLKDCASVGFDITHLYGLTETYGPIVICDWRSEWSDLASDDQAALRARQGVANVVSCRVRVVDEFGDDVPADGATVGEVALRGNTVMLGYFNDEEATAKAIPDGWFRTGDLGVLHDNGYLEIRDRAKDVIISGGENISSVEVEAALATHSAVLEAAVVSAPDERWGERPVAWITLKPGRDVDTGQLQEHLRGLIARYKVPNEYHFGPLPKTASGKIKKHELRNLHRLGDA